MTNAEMSAATEEATYCALERLAASAARLGLLPDVDAVVRRHLGDEAASEMQRRLSARLEDNYDPDADAAVVLARVRGERVRWLWPGRIPLGKLTILDGDPGLGKSTLALDLAARLSRGDVMPDGAHPDVRGAAGSVLLTAEDGLADTVRPRLDAADADCARIVALRRVPAEDGTLRFPTVADVEAIEEQVERVDARLVVIDPLMAYLGGDVNSYRDQDVRAALTDLAALADRTGVAVLAIRHLTKASGGNPLYRGGGSIGLIGAARSGLLVARDPNDETGSRRVLALTKSNLAAPPRALAYELEAEGWSVRVAWRGETDHHASELLSAPDGEERTKLDDAKEFLRHELVEAPVPSKELQRRARDAGHAWRTVERAANELGVEKRREGFGADALYKWALPMLAISTNLGEHGDETPRKPAPHKGSPMLAKGSPPFGEHDAETDPPDGARERLEADLDAALGGAA